VDLAAYLRDICVDLAELAPHCELVCQAEGPVPMGTDRAVRIGLLTTELVTNAAKHAGPGRVVVRLVGQEAAPSVTLTVSDDGPGLPDDFDVEKARTLGMKIIMAIVAQMDATFTPKRSQTGAEFVVQISKNPS
jgi:two-component sensor histidine kinase